MCDTAGQEDFKDLRFRYIRDADAACFIFMYAVDDENSLNYIQELYDDVISVKKKLPPTLIIGNKCDLADSMEVSEEEARNWANMNNINYFQTSALTGEGLTEVVDALMKMLPRHHTPIEVVEIATERKKWRCC